MIKIISGDLLEAKEKYIAHQCNCISISAGGIAYSIFEKFPYSDIYSNRIGSDIPGTIKIMGNGLDERLIINMCSQYYPGSSYDSTIDNKKIREKYFHQCLLRIAKISNLESIAFPYLIGCGIGGGTWENYLGNLEIFAKHVYDKQKANTTIYKLEQ